MLHLLVELDGDGERGPDDDGAVELQLCGAQVRVRLDRAHSEPVPAAPAHVVLNTGTSSVQ